jgi:hypothetical protein
MMDSVDNLGLLVLTNPVGLPFDGMHKVTLVVQLCEGVDTTEAKLGVSLDSGRKPDGRCCFTSCVGLMLLTQRHH